MTNEADPLDKAADLAQMYADHGIANASRGARPQQTQNADGTWPITECVDCGDDLPPPRLRLGRIRCVFCQEDLERRKLWNK